MKIKTTQGFFFGVLVVLSVWNSVFIVFACITCFIFSGNADLFKKNNAFLFQKNKVFLFFCFFLTSIYIFIISYSLKGYGFSFSIAEIAKLLIFVFFLFTRKNHFFLKGLTICIYCLFIVDFTSNVSQLILGYNLFGQTFGVRNDDLLLSRYTGIMNNAYYSISITLVTFIYALINKHKFFVLLALSVMLTNSSLKALMYLTFIISLFTLLCFSKRKYLHYLFIYIFVALFLFFIYLSLSFLPEGSGNFYRIFAYNNGLSIISSNPFFGGGAFEISKISGINESNLLSRGSTESSFLHFGAFYGVFPMFTLLLGFILLINQKYIEFMKTSVDSCRIEYVISLFLLFDFFLGSFFGSTFVIATIGYILLSKNIDE